MSRSTSTTMSFRVKMLGCLPSHLCDEGPTYECDVGCDGVVSAIHCAATHRRRRSSRSACTASTRVAAIGVVFLMATFAPVSRFLQAQTTPKAPFPSALIGAYLRRRIARASPT